MRDIPAGPHGIVQELSHRQDRSRLLFHPVRSSYVRGEWVEAQVYRIDGQFLGHERFEIGDSPGSGFAGQVYAARALWQPWAQAGPTGWRSRCCAPGQNSSTGSGISYSG